MTRFLIDVAVLAVTFAAGKRYGATVEKEAASVALAAFSKAKTALVSVVTKAQADVKAEAERLETLAKKYI